MDESFNQYPDYGAINDADRLTRLARIEAHRDELLRVCNELHTLLDEGCTLRAETLHQGKTVMAWLYDAITFEADG